MDVLRGCLGDIGAVGLKRRYKDGRFIRLLRPLCPISLERRRRWSVKKI